ncbi:MAG TPA: two-component regulator propeller domain-containing protein [Cytophagales bacterium]|nr:two-component regulator propeller domain-containing protein [Cytophagales bacterium]
MKHLTALLIILNLAFSTVSSGQRYNFSHLDINNGLSHNQINYILKDSRGFMWFGTPSGLNRYDGYQFKIFSNKANDSTTLDNNNITTLFEGPNGNIWVTTRTGLNIYDPQTESFLPESNYLLKKYLLDSAAISQIYKDKQGSYWFISYNEGITFYPKSGRSVKLKHNPKDSTTILSDEVSCITQDVKGNYWVIHRNGALEKLDAQTHKVIYRNEGIKSSLGNQSFGHNIIADKDGDLWIFSTNNNYGLFLFKPANNTLTHIHKNSSPLRLNTDIVRGVVEDDKGLIWISTDHGGINLLDKKNLSVTCLLEDPNNEKSLSQNSINAIYKDDEGIIWLGTFKKGIDYYHENILKFELFKNQVTNPNSLPYDDVNRFVEDENGNLWIGTNGGGLIYFDRWKNSFKQFLSGPEKGSLKSDVIVSLCIDSDKQLWVGTYYGGLYKYDGKEFIQYKNDPNDPESISDDNIWEIYEDSYKNLWIGTLSGGLELFDRERNKFIHYKLGGINSIHSNYISSILEDTNGNLWIGTSDGVDVWEKTSGTILHYVHKEKDTTTICNNNILSILQDKKGDMWIGTSEGLNLLNKDRKVVKVFTREDGLPHNSILTILEDNKGSLWISTPKGLSNLIVSQNADESYSYRIKNYNEPDGLQGKVFNENAALKTRKGELIFGGVNGFNIFSPSKIEENKRIPKIIFSDLQVFNKSVKAGEKVNGRILLPKAISKTSEFILRHDENIFSVEVLALNYFHPEKNKYQYKLEGFDDTWRNLEESSRKVTYTNLDPGEYILKVKASNNDGYWNNTGSNLKINILPPVWKTKTAYVFYIILLIALLWIARKMIIARARMRFTIEQDRQEALRIHELDMMKIKFFTNISHEFRTPISLVITPIEKILKTIHDPDQKSHLQVVHKNAKRLLNLVNQLLDFRKMEVQEIKLNLSEGDIIDYIKEVISSFSDISDKKNIKFSFHSNVKELNTFFDQDKLEKILFNLLSNAFKFTPEGGTVSVDLSLKESNVTTKDQHLSISIKDTGIGIPAEKHSKIFERFFQNDLPGSLVNQGSGIGLSITKEFVKIHGGKIAVESEPEKGSCFIVTLPITEINSFVIAESAEGEEIGIQKGSSKIMLQQARKDPHKQNLLLVEDNEDFRFYLKDNLKTYYNITEAGNGAQGWEQALNEIPDLIVSDVMMPEMDGVQFCKKIRGDLRTSHIPFILLTARSAEEQKLEGYDVGASDYITKPFNFEILHSRIKNLITQRDLMRKSFKNLIEVKPNEIEIVSLDQKLIKKAIDIVEANISNHEFSVEDFSKEIGISRVHLYKKLLSLTGNTPVEFIRIIRVKRAADLLKKSQLTVAEIAYQVGFNNPKYFARYFKTEFNMIPSMYAKKFKEE